MKSEIAMRAPAKLNLALHVVGRREDGYHLIESLAVFTRHGDRLTIEASRQDRFAVTGPFAEKLAGETDNLVTRARDLLRRLHPERTRPPVAITLEKNLPVASGLGGGSSDAAAAIVGLCRHWGIETLPQASQTVGLGADIPMCIQGVPLIARGIGEETEPLPALPRMGVVLANPMAGVSTPAVYGALARKQNPPLPTLPAPLDFSTLCDWLHTTRNDLQAPAMALEPEIGRALAALEATDPGFARMSGSGATCFALFETPSQAERAARTLEAARPGWFVMATATGTAERMAA